MYFCGDFMGMTTTEAILNYAAVQGGFFQRKDLLRDIVGKQTAIKTRAVDLQIGRLVASGILIRKRPGEYQLAKNSLPEFVLQLSETERDIYQKLKKQFPFLDMCIWSPRVLTSFMLHVPNVGYTFVDVEKEGMEDSGRIILEAENIIIVPIINRIIEISNNGLSKFLIIFFILTI